MTANIVLLLQNIRHKYIQIIYFGNSLELERCISPTSVQGDANRRVEMSRPKWEKWEETVESITRRKTLK